jgi:hypothetical protein
MALLFAEVGLRAAAVGAFLNALSALLLVIGLIGTLSLAVLSFDRTSRFIRGSRMPIDIASIILLVVTESALAATYFI